LNKFEIIYPTKSQTKPLAPKKIPNHMSVGCCYVARKVTLNSWLTETTNYCHIIVAGIAVCSCLWVNIGSVLNHILC